MGFSFLYPYIIFGSTLMRLLNMEYHKRRKTPFTLMAYTAI